LIKKPAALGISASCASTNLRSIRSPL
jgi:hypothetical protein